MSVDPYKIVVGDIITYRNGVNASVLYIDFDDDPSIQKYTIRTAAFSGQYCQLEGDCMPDEWRIASIDSSKRPLTIAEWAHKYPEEANLLCCNIGHVVRNK